MTHAEDPVLKPDTSLETKFPTKMGDLLDGKCPSPPPSFYSSQIGRAHV